MVPKEELQFWIHGLQSVCDQFAKKHFYSLPFIYKP